MKIKVLLILVLLCVFGLLAAPDGFAAIYKYIDKNGMVTFADDLQSIPEQYRKNAVIVSGEAETEKKPMQQTPPQSRQETRLEHAAPSVEREQTTVDKIKESFFTNRAMISVMVVVSALFAFVILGIVDADHKKIIQIVRVVIVWGVSVYLIYAHAGDVVRLFRGAGNSIEDGRLKSEAKGKKAAKALKEMNELLLESENTSSPDSGNVVQEKRD